MLFEINWFCALPEYSGEKSTQLKSNFFPFGNRLGLYHIGNISLLTIFTNAFYSLGQFKWSSSTGTSSLWVEQVLFLEDWIDQKFSSGHVEFKMSVQYLNGDVEQAIGYMSLQFEKQFWQEYNFGVVSKQMTF